ncbi:MAG: hypothetical protein KDA37_00285 [Planctomycetales bacterium]|nr:hypothetical protein [Planctomycetales bacterium]
MIHYTCDGCQRKINPEEEIRYVVRLEVYAAFDAGDEPDAERDHLQEISDILEEIEDLDSEQVGPDVYQQVRYDLCSDCRKKFLCNPIGRVTSRRVGFSNN